MLIQQGLQGLLQHRPLQRHLRAQQNRLVPVLALGNVGGEKALLDRQQLTYALLGPALDHLPGSALGCLGGQAAHGLVLEDIPGAEMDAGATGTADQLNGNDGVATQLEEVIVQPHLRAAQHLLPHTRQTQFQGRPDALAGGHRHRCDRRGQSLAIKLAVGGQRQTFEDHPAAGQHIGRQAFAQCISHLCTQLGRRCSGVDGHQISQQVLLLAFLPGHHQGLGQRRMTP
ncbi:hypothetical protein D3C80_391350 [compost metagenome]